MGSEKFLSYECDTPFSSRTTVAEQYAQFLQTYANSVLRGQQFHGGGCPWHENVSL